MRFDSQVVLIVGGGSDGPSRPDESVPMGNGRAMAIRFSAEGATVAVSDVVEASAQQTIEGLPGEGLALQADAADPQACRFAVRQVVERFGRLDVVVCNVGITGKMPGRSQSVEDWDRTVAVNVRSHWITAQEALTPMLAQEKGALVFVTSTSALYTPASSLAYDATKAALLGVSRHFAVRYATRGIRSNAVALGVIDTPMVRREWGASEDLDRKRASMCPMGRQGRPEEAAAAAAFLASDDAAFITGTCLVVDGGMTAGRAT